MIIYLIGGMLIGGLIGIIIMFLIYSGKDE